MRDLNNMELQFISGGNLDKPVLQSSFKDLACYFGIGFGAVTGWSQGGELFKYSPHSIHVGQYAGQTLTALAGAAIGGIVATAAVNYVIPVLTGLVD